MNTIDKSIKIKMFFFMPRILMKIKKLKYGNKFCFSSFDKLMELIN